MDEDVKLTSLFQVIAGVFICEHMRSICKNRRRMTSLWKIFSKGMKLEKQFYEETENTRECFCHTVEGSRSRNDGYNSWMRRKNYQA